MRKLCLAFMVLAFAVSTFAQAPHRGERREFKPEEMATRQADYMKKELSLNDEQYKAVYKLFLKRGEETKAQRSKAQEGQQADREARRAAMLKSREAMTTELKQILTAEQYTKYEELQQKRQQQRQQKHHKQGTPHRN